jgi:hypothetical protein
MKRILIGWGFACLFVGVIRIQALDDPECKVVLNALAKLGETPHHQYIVLTNIAAGGVRESESICAGDVAYIKVNGQWTVGPMTPRQIARHQQENIQSAKVCSCKHERDEKLDGEMASLYKAHSENEDGVEDAEIWISKARGLILRQRVESNGGETQMSVRFVYTNVRAPQVK